MKNRSLIASLFIFFVAPATLLTASILELFPLYAAFSITPFAWTLAAKRVAARKGYQLSFGRACGAALDHRRPQSVFYTLVLFVGLFLCAMFSDYPSIGGWIFLMASMAHGASTGRRFVDISQKLQAFEAESRRYKDEDRRFIATALQVSEQDMQSVTVWRNRGFYSNQLFIYAASEKLSALTPDEIETLLAKHALEWEAVGSSDEQVILTAARESTLHRRILLRQANGCTGCN